MPRVLIVADLEGIAGVRCLEALIYGTPEHPLACTQLSAELDAVCEALASQGYDDIWVSDSHRSGSPTGHVLAMMVRAPIQIFYGDDAYARELFTDVSAIACLGMHAGAGGSGFAAHTVDLSAEWWLAGTRLNESQIVCGLAAECGIPGLFVSGDADLERELAGLLPYVCSKQVEGGEVVSRPAAEVHAALREAAAGPATPLPVLPAGELELRFKSCWQAAAAARNGGRRLSPRRVAFAGTTFRARYARALAALAAAGSTDDALRGMPGEPEFSEDVAVQLARRCDETPLTVPPAAIDAALASFLAETQAADSCSLALRALVLHMLEGCAPKLFARHRLAAVLAQAVEALAALPLSFAPGMSTRDISDRVDAWYVQTMRGAELSVDVEALQRSLQNAPGDGAALQRWLCLEMARSLDADLPPPATPALDRLESLYLETHRVLLASDFLRTPQGGRLDSEQAALVERLLLAVPFVREHELLDLAGELLFCLVWLGERCGSEIQELLELLLLRQRADGSVVDHLNPQPAHPTATALLAFACVSELSSLPASSGLASPSTGEGPGIVRMC